MKWREFITDYLTFTRRDRIAVLTIIIIITGIFLLPTALSNRSITTPVTPDTAWIAAMKRIEQKQTESGQQNYNEDNSTAYQYDPSTRNFQSKAKGELFYFDPNTLSKEGWQKLGLRDKTIGTIQNYISKGGKFRKPEDLQRIYGLFPNEFERIAPYIKIESASEINISKDFTDNNDKENQPAKTYPSRYSIIDINTADTTAFISLPGIGSKLAFRVVTFRDKLGGFYSINQVGETFGLPDSTFQKIKQFLKLENGTVKKININTATVDQLKAHPYIRYILANPIIAYRNEHGIFSKIEDLKKLMSVTDEIYNKIAPYVTVQ